MATHDMNAGAANKQRAKHMTTPGVLADALNSIKNQKYKVVIEAHADEISWYVNYISDNGLIYVIRNGGSDHQIAPSKIVNIHTKNGIVKGVFGWPAIHTRNKANEEAPKPENIFIDCGCKTKEEVEGLNQTGPNQLKLARMKSPKEWLI